VPLTRVLFVCLGNICRSPLAEAALRAEATQRGLDIEVDSAGTGDWHIGLPPDPRAIAEAKVHGIDITAYKARQVTAADFAAFDQIIALDPQNLRDLSLLAPAGSRAALSLLLDYIPGRAGEGVRDPYYGDAGDFAIAWSDVSAGAAAIIEKITAGMTKD
jgi:protein-tyrosine phosphatase